MSLNTQQINLVKKTLKDYKIIYSCNTSKQISNPEDATNKDFTTFKGQPVFWFNINDPNGSTGTMK